MLAGAAGTMALDATTYGLATAAALRAVSA
jgi:hypothetical protein